VRDGDGYCRSLDRKIGGIGAISSEVPVLGEVFIESATGNLLVAHTLDDAGLFAQ
jgi:hypothetical protein